MKKTIYILILILSMIANCNHAQNLVSNYSFESYSICPSGSSEINKATPWKDPTGGTSDYFNTCANVGQYANIPFCDASGVVYQWGRTGNAIAGLWALNGMGNSNREYIQGTLTSPLVADSCYLIEFYCNLSNGCRYAINQLGAYLSNTPVNAVGPSSVMSFTPQVVSDTFLTDTLNWMPVSGYYHAIGGEMYITIGGFKPFGAGDTLLIDGTGYYGAYYFIDDVSITKLPGCDTTLGTGIHEQKNDLSFNLYPNPNNGTMILDYKIASADVAVMQLFDLTGKLIGTYELNSSADKLQISNNKLNNGIYFYSILVNNKTVKQDKLVIIK